MEIVSEGSQKSCQNLSAMRVVTLPFAFRCHWCRKELIPATMRWWECALLLILLRTYKCPHCFERYQRPLQISPVLAGMAAGIMTLVTIQLMYPSDPSEESQREGLRGLPSGVHHTQSGEIGHAGLRIPTDVRDLNGETSPQNVLDVPPAPTPDGSPGKLTNRTKVQTEGSQKQ
jgi:hypothetical protein